MSGPLLELDAITKSFGGVTALQPVKLELCAGEVLGLVGENGAGKSTLIKILSGVHQPDGGTIRWNGNPVTFQTPLEALETGIATIHQELAYFGRLTVAENLLMGETWPRYRWGGVNWRQLRSEAQARLTRCGLDIPTHRIFNDLSSAQKQEIAIARALSRNARLLILDEPTASLSEPELKRLFSQLKRLRREGVSILYISHRLDEIFDLANRIAVLRDGALVATHKTDSVNLTQIIRDMVGRPLDQIYPHSRSSKLGPPLLELRNVTRSPMFQNIDVTVHAGEIVGLAGLVGAGRSELARAIYGLYPIDKGTMRLCGRDWRPRGPNQALKSGLAYLPEERKRQGLVLDHSLKDSISIGFSDLMLRFGLVPWREELARVEGARDKYGIRARSSQQAVGTLSGGNQQKALLARWLDRNPSVILLDEPTRGVDIGAKAEIHTLIDQLAGQGKAIFLISSDLPEVLGVSDRILVIHQGSVSVELRGSDMTQENVILAASGMYGNDHMIGRNREIDSGMRD